MGRPRLPLLLSNELPFHTSVPKFRTHYLNLSYNTTCLLRLYLLHLLANLVGLSLSPKTDHRPLPPSKPLLSHNRSRAPGGLWQTPYSQPVQQYHPLSIPSPAMSRPSSRSFPAPAHSSQPRYHDPRYEHRNAYTQSRSSSTDQGAQEYQQSTPLHSHQRHAPTNLEVVPGPAASASAILKQRQLEFAREQEELQNRFKREQEEQLARFMQAQEDLRKQLLREEGGS